MKGIILLITALFFAAPFSLFSQEYISDTAKSGDGIYRFLDRNGVITSKTNVDLFKEINKDKLGDRDILILGKQYYLPITKEESNSTVVNTKIESDIDWDMLFKLDHPVQVKDSSLKGACFYLISGHGGIDPGAVGYKNGHQLPEDEYAYDITLRLAKLLLESGANVFMIIQDSTDGIRSEEILEVDRDEYCYPKESVAKNSLSKLKQRTDAANGLYLENKTKYSHHRLLCIHVDSRSVGERIDVFFYHHKTSTNGKSTAENILNVFDEKYNKYQPGRGYDGSISSRELYVIKNTYPPCVFIELGNIQNQKDQARFLLKNNRQALAKWLYLGLVRDFLNE